MTRATLLVLIVAGSAHGAHAEPIRLNETVVAHVRQIHARNPELRDDAFSKMGGSSVVSRAFLRCFATPYVELGEHQDLADAIAYFKGGDDDPFSRESEAAGVSWNLRSVLAGRPARYRRELERTKARWALLSFGGNDAQNENELIYLRRLVYLIEQLEEMGVVPVLGTAAPRRNRHKDLWVRRFNAITQAVAEHWAFPIIDYHAALRALPRKGLARDGVHPNVFGHGGFRAACQLTDEALRYGNNTRNLLTLQMLEALKNSLPPTTDTAANTAPVPVPAPVPAPDTAPVPASALLDKPSLPALLSLPPGCGSPKPGSRFYRTRLSLLARTRLRASAFDLSGHKPRVFWVRADEEGERCVRRRIQTLEVDARPGMWDFIVEVPERAAHEGQMLILITHDER